MKSHSKYKLAVSATIIFFVSSILTAQNNKSGDAYVPEVGQQGKDVVWVPTPQELVDTMLSIAKVTPSDFVMDLGSGDGRTVISAAKKRGKSSGN